MSDFFWLSRCVTQESYDYIVAETIHFAEKYDIDIIEACKIKAKYNKSRPYRHGNKKA